VGFDEVTGETAGPFRDKFLEDRLLNESWLVVDQSRWLFSHSGMRIPSEEVFNRSYDAAIMRRVVNEGGGFGRY
jgi:hypothetical protein